MEGQGHHRHARWALIAIDKKSGKEVWSAQTFGDHYAYTITGAPRVFGGKVVIGNSGGDMGVRGFVAAYDADTGKKLWKFFLTPNDPAKGPDGEASDPMMDTIRKTWSENGMWKELGGGANPWDSIAYDPKLNLVYVGTGNGSPNSWYHRSNSRATICSSARSSRCTRRMAPMPGTTRWCPRRSGIIPAPSSIVSADLEIDGKMRKVIMQAPKDGYFYVLDRKTGELISAKTYVKVNWAKGLDPKTGRPIINPRSALRNRSGAGLSGPGRGAQLVPDGLQSAHQARLFPGL